MILALLLAATPVADALPSTRSLYLQLIHQARADGRPRAAIAYLDDFDRRYPGDPDARTLRINSLLDLGDIDGAEATAATMPAAPSAVRGHLLAARSLWAEAIPFYQSAIQASPADPLLRNALGYAQLRGGATIQAIETLRGALDLAPTERVIRNNLLLALTVDGQRTEVDAALRLIRNEQERDALRDQLAQQVSALSARKGS